MNEIAETIKLPKELDQEWSIRGYYGSVSHDSKAVYQKYLGWYDNNPANLNPLPPTEAGKKYVEYMGGAPAIIKKAKESYAKGEYRWVAEVMSKVVFADPNNKEAKNLEADALEQLGYQTENGTWRNNYLMGAYELRNGVVANATSSASPDTITAMTTDMLLDFKGIQLNAEKAAGKKMVLYWEQPDTKEKYTITLENSVLMYRKVDSFTNKADVTMSLPKTSLNNILLKQTTMDKEISEGRVKITGDRSKLQELMGMTDTFNPAFNIVTP